jgi:phospholipid/cholesterol/gamma-HCH transport system ATP-binding protein
MTYGSFVVQRDIDFAINRGDIFIIMGGERLRQDYAFEASCGTEGAGHGQGAVRQSEFLGR